MSSEDLAFASATEQAELVRKKEVSPVELVKLYLERIERIDPALNSYVLVTGEQALAQAETAETALADGGDLPPFHGVPISIKDLSLTKGVRTTLGSRAFADFVPDIDEQTVVSLRDAGFIMLGKTNTPEFGIYPWTESDLLGICRNPWNTGHTPGGSSGGAAAALAAGLCSISQGGDGGGSIRIPSSCCGVFGVKPARGRVSLAPLFGDQISGLVTHGPLTHTVADAAGMLDAMAGYVTGDPYWAPAPVRPFVEEVGADPGKLCVGVVTVPPFGYTVHPDAVAAIEDAAKLLGELGHDVLQTQIDLPNEFVQQFMKLWMAGIAGAPVPDWNKTESKTQELAELGRNVSAGDYLMALTALQAIARQVVGIWDRFDVLITPTTIRPPLEIQEHADKGGLDALVAAAEFVPFTPIFNLTGQPAVSAPLFWNDDGLPIGTHIVGRPADEATLFRVSAQLEEARPWRGRRPPVEEQAGGSSADKSVKGEPATTPAEGPVG